MHDWTYYENLVKKGDKEVLKHFKKWCSITDLENLACDIFYEIHKLNCHNIIKTPLKNDKSLLERLLVIVLKYRSKILNQNFVWTEEYKKQLFELNKKLKHGFSAAYNEAKILFDTLIHKVKSNDLFLNDFNIEIKLSPLILEPNEKDYTLEERNKSIYYVLYNTLPKDLWTDTIFAFDEYNNDCYRFGFAWCQLLSCKILSWYDILKINEIWVEVNVTHQHFIENIGKGKFWDDGIQSLSDNESENLRQEYMDRLSKEMTGLPVEMLVDELGAWEKIGPYKRVKFQGNKENKSDFKKMYSMSIEKSPRILVKDAVIDLSDNELEQVKIFVSKNMKQLLQLEKGKIDIIGFMEAIKKI
jgi:hypothetical protein